MIIAVRSNPPRFTERRLLLGPEHPLYSKFARLTQQEDKHGLLEVSQLIGTKDGWKTVYEKAGFVLRGHRLVRAKPATCEEGEQ